MSIPVLRVENLCKKYGGLTAVDNVNFILSTGERKILMGPNGAGKTTLLSLIAGTSATDGGDIFLNGQRIGKLPVYKRQRLGLSQSFQIPRIIPTLSVLDNLSIAYRPNSFAGFKDWILNTDKVVKNRACYLLEKFRLDPVYKIEARYISHAERKKLDVACALIQSPTVLLLDEPTAGLRSDESSEMATILMDELLGTSAIIIEHDLKFIQKISGNIIFLNQGKLVKDGPSNEVITSLEFQEIYLGYTTK